MTIPCKCTTAAQCVTDALLGPHFHCRYNNLRGEICDCVSRCERRDESSGTVKCRVQTDADELLAAIDQSVTDGIAEVRADLEGLLRNLTELTSATAELLKVSEATCGEYSEWERARATNIGAMGGLAAIFRKLEARPKVRVEP